MNFYKLEDPLATKPLRLTPSGYDDLSSEQAFKLQQGKISFDKPIHIGSYMGSYASDFLWSGLVGIMCISDKLKTFFEENGITGWKTYPVELHDRENSILPRYHGLSITGCVCDRDKDRSQIIEKPIYEGGKTRLVYKGLFFNENQWDGSDFFFIRSGFIIVTNKLFSLFNTNRIKNIRLTPLSDVEINVSLDKYEK